MIKRIRPLILRDLLLGMIFCGVAIGIFLTTDSMFLRVCAGALVVGYALIYLPECE